MIASIYQESERGQKKSMQSDRFLHQNDLHPAIDRIASIPAMLLDVTDPQTLGLLTRATRKTHKLRMDDVAGSAGVGHVFVRDIERGKPTVQFGRMLKVLHELGLQLKVDVPDEAMPAFSALRTAGLKPPKPRVTAQRKSPTPVAPSSSRKTQPLGKRS